MSRVAELLARARQSAQEASQSTSFVPRDELAAQEQVISLQDDDDDQGSSRPRSKKRKRSQLIEPASVQLPPLRQGISLSQDLSESLVSSTSTEQGSKWGKLPYTSKKQLNKANNDNKRARTTGKEWFDMPATPVTKDVKRELQALRLLNTLDPKSFMRQSSKDDKKWPEFFQIGYVLPSDQRATTQRNDSIVRKESFVQQLVDNERSQQFLKRKTDEVRSKGMSGKQKSKKARRRSRP